jgi:predicted membrane channel-forming protein YqfA (hemolysin III family)
MNTTGRKFSLSFRLSGVLLIVGLCIEAISLFWVHPLAFLAFFVIGGVFLAAGVLLYLSSIIFHPSQTNPNDSRSK